MGKLRIFAVLLLWVSSGFAVTNCTRYDSIAQQNKNGVSYVIPNASIQVCTQAAVGIPCAPTATVYSDNACSVVTGSVNADVNGNFHFYAVPGIYKYQVSGGSVATLEISDLTIPSNPLQSSVQYAAPAADGGASINAAIAQMPNGGTVNTCLMNSIQAVLTPIVVNQPVKIQQCGGQTLQLANGAGITISNNSAAWEGNSQAAIGGIVGGIALISAQSKIQAQAGFIGPLITITIGSGARNGGIWNLGIDCKNEAGVTAGLAYTANQQNWGVVHDVAIGNCPGDAFQTASGVGSMRFQRIFTNNVGTAFDMGFASNNDNKIEDSRLLFTNHGVIIGSDDANAGNTSSSDTIIMSDVSNTVTGSGSEHVLVRNAIETVISTGNRFETLGSSTITQQIVLGTATPSTPAGTLVTGNAFLGNAQAVNGVAIVSATNPKIVNNVASNITGRMVNNQSTTSGCVIYGNNGGGLAGASVDSVTGCTFVLGDSTNANPQLKTPLAYIAAAGSDGFAEFATGDTNAHIAMRNNGTLEIGPGNAGYDLGLSRSAAGTLAVGNGNQGNAAAAVRAAFYSADGGTACTNGELGLSAGWQSTGSATVTGVVGTGQTCEWTITTGTTTAANPTVTDTLTNALPSANTVCWMIITGGNRTAAAADSFDQTTLSATAPIFTFQGTPTAGGKTYKVVRTCGP